MNKSRRSHQEELLEGYRLESLGAIKEFLRFKPRAIKHISCKKFFLKTALEELKEFEINESMLSDNDPEQVAPIAAMVDIQPRDDNNFFAECKEKTRDVTIALDHITDTRNLGAIVRSAAFYGIEGVIAPKDRQTLLTQAGVATAMGGFAVTDLVPVVNLGRALEELKELGYWIIGADMDGEPCSKIVGVYEKVVLVLGSEDKGLSPNIRKKCDRFVKIEGAGGKIESLNVSVATGILLDRFCQR